MMHWSQSMVTVIGGFGFLAQHPLSQCQTTGFVWIGQCLAPHGSRVSRTPRQLLIVYPSVRRSFRHDDVFKWKHFPRYWPFDWGIHRWPVNSPHKGQWRGALMFSLIWALNKRLSEQLWGWWFETSSRSLWRHCNELPGRGPGPCSVGWQFIIWQVYIHMYIFVCIQYMGRLRSSRYAIAH